MKKTVPQILLIGVGRFGRHHLEVWKKLEAAGEVRLVGAVCSSPASARRQAEEFSIPLHGELTDELLAIVDAVDVATPAATHRDIIRRCLSQCDVFAEKPLTMTPEDSAELGARAKELGRVLMVSHLYRHHAVTGVLLKRIKEIGEAPLHVTGRLLNPKREADAELDVNLEFLHLADVLDYLFEEEPVVRHVQQRGNSNRLSLRYPSGLTAVLDLGWRGSRRVRSLVIEFSDRRLEANFALGIVTEFAANALVKHFAPSAPSPLTAAIQSFLGAIQDRGAVPPTTVAGADTAERVERAVAKASSRDEKKRRIAVVGGGVFGGTCAIELASLGEVVLYERHDELLTEASFANQWRHHSGFHYPRSFETIIEIQESKADFESVYSDIILPIESYYATAASAKRITADHYLAVCRAMKLDFLLEQPPAEFLDPDSVSLCLKSDEQVLDFAAMRRLIRERVEAEPNVNLQLGTGVVGARLESDGRKTLTVEHHGTRVEESFDYVLSASYANFNLLPSWLGLPLRRLRFDYCEMLVLQIDMPAISMTVLDGPFTSLVATGHDNLFILSQMHQSVLWSEVPADGLPPSARPTVSNRENLMQAGRRYFPILEQARFVESRFGLRTVVASNADYDARPTVATAHGFGCWSLLGGKILTCVTNARSIAREIREDTA